MKATRQSFGEAIVKQAEQNHNIVVLDADLGKSTATGEFLKRFPERYLELGIAEHNMIGTAAGLALCGKIPYATSFACFLVSRFETIRMSVGYMNTNVRLIGTHAGVGIGEDGNSQMGLEDIALLRPLPNMVILQPADDVEAQAAVAWSVGYQGPVYFRLTRQKLADLHKSDYVFRFGKGDVLFQSAKPAQGVAIFATGGVVANALEAARQLDAAGIPNALINIHTIQPLDRDLVVKMVQTYRACVTVEDHSVTGGLGSAVAEVLSEAGVQSKLCRLGVRTYGESGAPEELYEKYGFSAEKILQSIQKFLA